MHQTSICILLLGLTVTLASEECSATFAGDCPNSGDESETQASHLLQEANEPCYSPFNPRCLEAYLSFGGWCRSRRAASWWGSVHNTSIACTLPHLRGWPPFNINFPNSVEFSGLHYNRLASLACGQPHYFSLIACCILLFAAFFLIVVALPINKSCCIFCLIAFHIISCCIIALHKLAAVFALIISFSCMPCCLFSSLPAHMYHVNLLHVCPCSDLGDGPPGLALPTPTPSTLKWKLDY